MKFSYHWLKELSGTKLSAVELAAALTMHSFEVEGVEKVRENRNGFPGDEGAKRPRSGKDYVLHIDVLPNRAHDCFSHIGVAREVAALSGSMSRFRKSEPQKPQKLGRTQLGVRVEIQDRGFGSRYLGVVVEGLRIKPSTARIEERLRTLGIKTINNVVDITNYVMLETGMPLHAFDLDAICGTTMTVRAAKKGEKLVTLDGKERVLPEGTLVIQDAERLIDLAGTMGGANSAVSQNTTRIFLQAAVFDPVRIYRSTREMNFRTEASVRYTAGLDPSIAEAGLARAVELLEKEGGNVAGKIDIYPEPRKPQTIMLDIGYVERLLGMNVPEKKIAEILETIGCVISGFRKSSRISEIQKIDITVPTIRLDLQTPEDLIEEIGRIIGYENIGPVMPVSTIIPAHETEVVAFAEKVRDALSVAGMTEAYNYSLTARGTLALENPISDERAYLRPSLVPGLKKNGEDNLRFFEEVRMFEIGKVFRPAPAIASPLKPRRGEGGRGNLVGGITERWSVGGIIAKNKAADELFYDLKGIVDGLLESLGIPERWYDDYKATPEPTTVAGVWQKGKTAEIKIGDAEVGFLGAVVGVEKGQALTSHKASQGTAVAFELDMELLMKLAREEREYQPLPKYPSVTRDISILVDVSVRIQDVENAIEGSGAKYIQDVDLFDIYEGSELGEGRKSLAFHIIYQAEDHTLTDAAVNQEHQKVEKALQESLNAEIR